MAKTNESGNPRSVSNGKELVPPHNVHLARKLNVVKCRVDLYKIPPKCINFEPTSTHLYLDTFTFTKKYCLNVPYPEGVAVDTNVEATFVCPFFIYFIFYFIFLFYSILFYSILFYSILFYSILFYFILCISLVVCQ
eukprot:Phypoly_transcript_18764.p1 GENE.Phypoly_transcript_18764~~Phypoly_transcript_18764.p1  ORF type:complete len:137 (-),score=1.46 Phypoly_transcript_18764:259-669(-)